MADGIRWPPELPKRSLKPRELPAPKRAAPIHRIRQQTVARFSPHQAAALSDFFSIRLRSFGSRYFFRIRTADGVTSTSSSSSM